MKVRGQAMKEGVFFLPAPPLTVIRSEIDFAMGVFARALILADEKTTK